MSLIEELGELSFVCAGQHERINDLEQLLREYYQLLKDYDEHLFFRLTEEERAQLQKRAKQLLGEK